jgi:hypothetical protein
MAKSSQLEIFNTTNPGTRSLTVNISTDINDDLSGCFQIAAYLQAPMLTIAFADNRYSTRIIRTTTIKEPIKTLLSIVITSEVFSQRDLALIETDMYDLLSDLRKKGLLPNLCITSPLYLFPVDPWDPSLPLQGAIRWTPQNSILFGDFNITAAVFLMAILSTYNIHPAVLEDILRSCVKQPPRFL